MKLYTATHFDDATQKWVGVIFRRKGKKVEVLDTETADTQAAIDDWLKLTLPKYQHH